MLRGKRLFRFGLRFLLALVAVVGVVLGVWTNAERRRMAAVAAIREAGGKVGYGYQYYHNQPGEGGGSFITEVRSWDTFPEHHPDAPRPSRGWRDLIEFEAT